MAAKFKQIVISSAAELERIINHFEDYGGNHIDFIDAVQLVQNPTLEQELDTWLSDTGIDLCGHGRKKVLKAAKEGIITSWPQYLTKHWNDNDGVLGWFEQEDAQLVGHSIQTGYESDPDGWGDYIDYESFAKFRKANPGLKFIKWPFAAKAPQAKKKKSSAKRKK